ncbi:MAG: hypothetical protein IPM35_20405 [Myxococcales bacterium]|nr:hypothetical protein [Myxococcales bacterium]
MADLAHQVDSAIEALKTMHASQVDQWTTLFLALGRARQALAANDTSAARDWLTVAEADEYRLTGSADTCGAVVEAIEREVQHG